MIAKQARIDVMRLNNIITPSVAFVLLILCGLDPAQAQCPALPNQLTNGQTADATQVMANFNALSNCAGPAGAANAIQYNTGAGSLGGLGPLTNGQLVIGATGAAPQAQTLTAGSGIAITNGAGSISISATGSSAPPMLVQSAFTRITSGTSGTVTLTSAPTPGNLLVAIATGYGGTAATLSTPNAFNKVYSNINVSVSNQGIMIAAHVVQSGDGTSWPGFSGGNGGNVFGIIELSGAHAVQASVVQGTQSASTWPFFAGSAGNAYTFFVLENDSTNGYSSLSNATLLFDGTNTAANHPAIIATTPAGSAANAIASYTGSNFSTSLFAAVAITP